MNFSWNEYLMLAKEMAGQTSPIAGLEARQRTSISRAYYAAFCEARNYLIRKRKFTVPPIDSHKAVIEEFKKIGSATNPLPFYISTNLGRLKSKRKKADYYDVIYNIQRETAYCILLASDTLNYLMKI